MITQKPVTRTLAILTAGLLMITAGCASTGPATPAAPSNVPAGIQQLVKDDAAAMKSANTDKIMANYSKDYKNDGRDHKSLRGVVEQYAPILSSYWEIEIKEVQMEGDNMGTVTKGTLSNTLGMGQNIAGMKLIKEDGQWKWYGNRK